MPTKRCAVIGIGGIGKWHGQMMHTTGRLQVAAVCDVQEKHRALAAEEFPEAIFYSDAAAMLAQEALELVAVVTPHDLHAPLVIAALQAGAHVVVEKPMATSYADCRAMIQAAQTADRSLTVFHNRRLDGWFLAARSAVRDGLLGNLIELNIGINFAPGPQSWRGWKATCGGIVFDWGAHLVDYALQLADSEVRAVSGFFYRTPGADPARNEDHGTIRLHFASGSMANVTVSGAGQVPPHRFHLIGDRGTLVDEWNWGEQDKLKVVTRLSGGEPVTMEIGYQKTVTQRYYDNLAAHLWDGTPLLVTAESAARIINILTTAERSHAQGGVPLPLEG
jgi:scyllo-inositol 2-dehydrogenase (NADP+)